MNMHCAYVCFNFDVTSIIMCEIAKVDGRSWKKTNAISTQYALITMKYLIILQRKAELYIRYTCSIYATCMHADAAPRGLTQWHTCVVVVYIAFPQLKNFPAWTTSGMWFGATEYAYAALLYLFHIVYTYQRSFIHPSHRPAHAKWYNRRIVCRSSFRDFVFGRHSLAERSKRKSCERIELLKSVFNLRPEKLKIERKQIDSFSSHRTLLPWLLEVRYRANSYFATKSNRNCPGQWILTFRYLMSFSISFIYFLNRL